MMDNKNNVNENICHIDERLHWVDAGCQKSYQQFVAKYASLVGESVDSLLDEVAGIEDHCEEVFPEVGDLRLKEFFQTHGFEGDSYRKPVENMKEILSDLTEFGDIKRMIGTAVFENALEKDAYQEADMLFREVRLNPIVRVEVTETHYNFYSETEKVECPYSNGICEVRGKLILLPQKLRDRFDASRYLTDALRRVSSEVLAPHKPIDLNEGEKFLHRTLPAVRERNPDDFYAINDKRGLMNRAEVYDSYLLNAYQRILLDNPSLKTIALVDPTPRDTEMFRLVILDHRNRTQNFLNLVVMGPHLDPDPLMLIVKSAFNYHLGSAYYFTKDDDVGEVLSDRMALFGDYMRNHVGVSRFAIPYNSYPWPTGYIYRVSAGKKYLPYSVPVTGINAGMYFSLPHRTRNIVVFKPGRNFSQSDWWIVKNRMSKHPLGSLLLRIQFSVERNLCGLNVNHPIFDVHESILSSIRENQLKYVSEKQISRFKDRFEYVSVFCQDKKRRLCATKPKVSLSVIVKFVKSIPLGRDSAVSRYKIKADCSNHGIDDLLSYAVESGLICEDLGPSYVKYYVPTDDSVDDEVVAPGPRSNVIVTDGYGIMGNLMTPEPILFSADDVNRSFYHSMFRKTQVSSIIDTGKSTPKQVRARNERRFQQRKANRERQSKANRKVMLKSNEGLARRYRKKT